MCHDQGLNKIHIPEIYTQIYNCGLNSLLFTEKNLCRAVSFNYRGEIDVGYIGKNKTKGP